MELMRDILQRVAEKRYNIDAGSDVVWLPYGTNRLVRHEIPPTWLDSNDNYATIVNQVAPKKVFGLTALVFPIEKVTLISAFDPEYNRIYIAEHSTVNGVPVKFPSR